jgi:excinuclease UvrABC nuclease subunit
LLKHFGSSKKVREAPLDELQKVSGIGKELAGKIYTALRSKELEKRSRR